MQCMIHEYISWIAFKRANHKEHSWDTGVKGNMECILDNIIMLVLTISGVMVVV